MESKILLSYKLPGDAAGLGTTLRSKCQGGFQWRTPPEPAFHLVEEQDTMKTAGDTQKE